VHTVEQIYNLDRQGGQVLTTGTLFLEMKAGQKEISAYTARYLVDDAGRQSLRIKSGRAGVLFCHT